MKKLKDTCAKWKKETGLGFALYGTPAESLCYRFARIDKEHRGNILANFFTKLNGQILLLSTDEEIVGDYQKMISGILSNTFVLKHTPEGNTQILKDTFLGGQINNDQ